MPILPFDDSEMKIFHQSLRLALLLGCAFLAFSGLSAFAAPIDAATVLVRVNGEDITYGRVVHYTDMMAFLLKNKSPSITDTKLAKFKERQLKPFSDVILQRTMMETCLAKSNVVVLASVEEAKKKIFQRKYGLKGETYDQLFAKLVAAGYGEEFKRNFDFEVRYTCFVEQAYSNMCHVSDEDFRTTKERMAKYNARASATNELVLAHATKVLAEARRSGADFAKLADKYSQDTERNPGGDLGDCDENDFSDDLSLWRTLSRMKAGDVSEVMETDDGYAIFKVVRRNSAEDSTTGVSSLTLARIFFRRAYLYPEESDDSLRGDILEEKTEELNRRLIKEFRKVSTIAYPSGRISRKK